MIVIINVEHVLAHGADLRSIASYRGASVLYDAFAAQYQVIAFSMANEEIARWWLKRERMPKWANIHAADVLGNHWTAEDYHEWQIMQVRAILAAGWEVAFYVDSDFGAHERINKMGVPTMVIHRNLIIPGWRNLETASPRAWDTVVVDSD
jgi:hypothetical protein